MRSLIAGFIALTGVVDAQDGEAVQDVSQAGSVEERLVRLEQAIQCGDSPLVEFDYLDEPVDLKSFEWGLLLEVEGSYARIDEVSESDLILATVEFTTDAEVNDWLSGHVCVLWEEDETEENNLDAGYITVGRAFYAQAGKYYLPFGNFESAFVSDPLTLELAEINKTSLQVGYGSEWFGVCVGAFKGDDEDTAECLYAAVGMVFAEVCDAGVYWLSDLLETDGLADLNEDLDQREGGAGAYVNLYTGPVMVCAEVVAALADYEILGGSYVPLAYNLEASMPVAEQWTVGVKIEGSDDLYTEFDGAALSGKFHGAGYGAVVSYAFHRNATVSAEYMRLQELDDDADGDLATVQLAFEI